MLEKCRGGRIVSLMLLFVMTLMQVGCEDSGEVGVTVSCPSNAGKCQVGVTSGIVVSNSVKADFTSGASSSAISAHNVIWNVPTSDLTLNTQSPVQATLKATTDTNYQSSITVTLTPVASATSPVVTGYSVYTFGVESSAALSNWLSEVTANINSTGNLSVSSNPLFNELGNAGTYTVYVQVKSVQAGVTTLGSATYSDPGTPPPTRCTGSNCPNQP